MSDIVERLREDARIMSAASGFPTIAAELEEAAGEVENLRNLLRWSMRETGSQMGAFRGSGNDNADYWSCWGCNVRHEVLKAEIRRFDPKDFPHAKDCRYLAAIEAITK